MALYDLLNSAISAGTNDLITAGAIALTLLFFTVTIDFIYKLFLRFLPSNLR